jgi:hypothetical protein
MSGRTATITDMGDGRFIWNKLDKPDILVDGNFGEAFDTQSMDENQLQQDNVLPDETPTEPPGKPTNNPKDPNVNYGGYAK